MAVIDGVGSWAWIAHPNANHTGKPALFLDRDGVLTQEVRFLGHPKDVTLIPRAAGTIAAFNRADIPVIVVTNQSGIARGYFSWSGFEEVEAEIRRQLSYTAGAHLDAVFACGYHDAGQGELGIRNHPWCKPNPGMLLAAADRLDVRLEVSWIVGDRARDLAAGRAAGLAGGIHVMTGHSNHSERLSALTLAHKDFQVREIQDLGDALPLRDLMTGQASC